MLAAQVAADRPSAPVLFGFAFDPISTSSMSPSRKKPAMTRNTASEGAASGFHLSGNTKLPSGLRRPGAAQDPVLADLNDAEFVAPSIRCASDAHLEVQRDPGVLHDDAGVSRGYTPIASWSCCPAAITPRRLKTPTRQWWPPY